MSVHRTLRQLLAASVAVATGLVASQAHASGDEDAALIAGIAVLGAVDVGFGVYDLVVLGQQRDVLPEAAAAQLVGTGLQTSALHVAIIGMAQDHDSEAVFGLTFPAMLTGALASHGAWSLAQPDTPQERIVLGSTIIGINEAYTLAALAHAAAGEASPTPTAVGQIVTSIPTLSLSAYMFAQQDSSFRSGWMFLTAWSSGLLLHGAVSLFTQRTAPLLALDPRHSRRSPWQIDAAPSLSVVPDLRGYLAPSVGISGRM